MPERAQKEALSQQAAFIFKGTVKRLKAATMKNVPVDNRTAVVTVDQVIEAPKNLAHYAGKDITVQLGGRQKVTAGQEMLFHTNGWIFGESVAVQSVKQEPVKKTHAALLSRGGDPVQHKASRDLRKRLDEADAVVFGTVSTVRLPADVAEGMTRRMAAGAAAAPAASGPVSEHDPKWREAVVEVNSVHKGSHNKKTVILRFPSSTDVMWYKAPKFHPGQQGYFVLRKTTTEEREAGGAAERAAERAAEPEGAETYTALHPMDFQPQNQPGGIKALIETAADSH